jgi:hypothetical protein
MKRRLPLLLIAAGIALFLGGFAYDFEFAGIPYQDPTPQMQANYDFHARVASVIRWLGVGVILFGATVGVARLRKANSKQP